MKKIIIIPKSGFGTNANNILQLIRRQFWDFFENFNFQRYDSMHAL